MTIQHNLPIYGFHTKEEAEIHIEKNFMNTEYDDVEIKETVGGTFKIIKIGS